ncbi:MAG TPA: hypothetical protein VGM78_11170 [Ilumatobacteraceae bacterium]
MIELHAGRARCAISPSDGARVASLRIGDRELLGGRAESSDPMRWGSYPMVPWAGRVRAGRFTFDGVEHELPLDMPPHAIHGTGYISAWSVGNVTDQSAAMALQLAAPWPFGGRVEQTFSLEADALTCRLTVTAADRAMPVQVGWHPWFLKPTSAHLRFAHMYQRDAAGIPTGDLVTPPDAPWDDCFVEPLGPLILEYDDLRVTVSSDCDHWVVYDMPDHATCVEPQSGPPDAFNLCPNRLHPGESLTRWMRIEWRDPATDTP